MVLAAFRGPPPTGYTPFPADNPKGNKMAHPGGKCALLALCLAVGTQLAGGTPEELLPLGQPREQRDTARTKLMSVGWAALQQRALGEFRHTGKAAFPFAHSSFHSAKSSRRAGSLNAAWAFHTDAHGCPASLTRRLGGRAGQEVVVAGHV